MHYLVTGGCGFIGSHLAERLLSLGHQVTVIDNLSSGRRENLPPGAALLVDDIVRPGIFDALLENIDGCFHLAAIASVQKSTEEWLASHRVNAGGLLALLETLAHKKRMLPIVFASSAAVYGDCDVLPLKESAACTPFSAYGADKLACEGHARAAALAFGIPAIGLRFFNVYGPRQDPSSPYSGVISIFASRMKQHASVMIYGNGEQARDFIFVGDVVEGLITAMQKLENKQISYGIFNLCTGGRTSINQLADLISNLTRSRSPVTHGPARPGDIRLSVGDPALSSRLLGFHAATRLPDGLRQTLEHV